MIQAPSQTNTNAANVERIKSDFGANIVVFIQIFSVFNAQKNEEEGITRMSQIGNLLSLAEREIILVGLFHMFLAKMGVDRGDMEAFLMLV